MAGRATIRLRSLTILVLIELATIEVQVSGFTMARMQADVSSDLEPAASSHQAAHSELQPSNPELSVEKLGDSTGLGGAPQKIVPIRTTLKTDDIQKNNNVDRKVTLPDVTVIHNNDINVTNKSVTSKSQTVSNQVSTLVSPITKYKSNENTNTSEVNVNSTNQATTSGNTSTYSTTEVYSTTETDMTTTTSDKSLAQLMQIANISTQKNVSVAAGSNVTDLTTHTEGNDTTSTTALIMGLNTSFVIPDVQATTVSANIENTAKIMEDNIFQNSAIIKKLTSQNESVTTSPATQSAKETLSSEESASQPAYWKKYTNIDRKRPNSIMPNNIEPYLITTEKVTEIEDKFIEGQTVMPSISLEKVFNVTNNFGNEHLMLTSKLPKTDALEPQVSLEKAATASSSTEAVGVTDKANVRDMYSFISNPTTVSTNELGNTEKKKEVLSSQRAGFLNYSMKETTTADNVENVITTLTDKDVKNVTESSSNRDEQGIFKAASSVASQTQMTEDEINEDLVRDEIMKGFTQPSDKDNIQRDSNINDSLMGAYIDHLSVRPITEKYNSLYTVNPNYKPLKKLDVQPSKTFVRDPDDNSWRNESLSSLGIVFKAKNSSKPFTEVLKNKTESEFNSLTERNNKDEAPELRERLEKIAERRKSKKKKVEGDTSNSDYEESVERSTYGYGKGAEGPRGIFEIKTSTDIVTTYAPKLMPDPSHFPRNHPPESYEDEADYTLPNIDLKKYSSTPIVSPKPGEASASTVSQFTTQPTRPFFPERRPTVQYFPPRPTQRVNQPDYDDGFQQKLKSFSQHNAGVKVTPDYLTTNTPQFGRVSSTARRPDVATEYSVRSTDGFDRAAYVIKHLRDGVPETPTVAASQRPADYEDYDVHLRREVLDRFVENFNQHGALRALQFPLVYNTTVTHAGGGGSSALLRGGGGSSWGTGGGPPCDRNQVELTPEYELLYYVPDQEEREPVEPRRVSYSATTASQQRFQASTLPRH